MRWKIRKSDELYHYGRLGQKWGIRRYQNLDGSLTPAGREHYGVKAVKQLRDQNKGFTPEEHKLPVSEKFKIVKQREEDARKTLTKLHKTDPELTEKAKVIEKTKQEYSKVVDPISDEIWKVQTTMDADEKLARKAEAEYAKAGKPTPKMASMQWPFSSYEYRSDAYYIEKHTDILSDKNVAAVKTATDNYNKALRGYVDTLVSDIDLKMADIDQKTLDRAADNLERLVSTSSLKFSEMPKPIDKKKKLLK